MSGKRSVNRRGFIKTAAAGMAGFCFAPSVGAEQSETSFDLKPAQKQLITRTLGKTGITLPVISMGVMNSDNPNLVRAALDAGIVHLDTAWWYQSGRNEEMIGEVLKDRPRDSYFIATKVPGSVPLPYAKGVFPDDEVSRATLVDSFLKRVDTSLKRLRLEYVDILYLHNVWTREAVLFESLMETLAKLKKEGKAKFLGISTHRNEPEVIEAAIDSKLYQVVLTAYNFKQDHRLEVQAAIAKAAQAGLGVIAMKTMAGGYHDEEKTKPVNAKAALKWVLQDENVHTIISGFTTFDQMELDISVMEDLTLEDSEKQDLQLESSMEESSRGGIYCQACEKCMNQCPQRLPIPDIMRAYMYAQGYQNLGEAQNLLFSLNLSTDTCDHCERCAVSCARGFDVSRRIRDVIRLQEVPPNFVV
jgi:predicted aldo/keto reductase-like oxidoreductase